MGRGRRKNQHGHETAQLGQDVPVASGDVHVTLSEPAAPEPEPKPVAPRSCGNCRWSDQDRYSNTGDLVPPERHLNCRLNPPVFVGLRYQTETFNRALDQFAYPKVRTTDLCSYHEYKA